MIGAVATVLVVFLLFIAVFLKVSLPDRAKTCTKPSPLIAPGIPMFSWRLHTLVYGRVYKYDSKNLAIYTILKTASPMTNYKAFRPSNFQSVLLWAGFKNLPSLQPRTGKLWFINWLLPSWSYLTNTHLTSLWSQTWITTWPPSSRYPNVIQRMQRAWIVSPRRCREFVRWTTSAPFRLQR